jgi:hypothetical protein
LNVYNNVYIERRLYSTFGQVAKMTGLRDQNISAVIPLRLQTFLIFFIAYGACKLLKLPYDIYARTDRFATETGAQCAPAVISANVLGRAYNGEKIQ